MIETLLVFPAPPPPELSQCLDENGWIWKSISNYNSALEDQPDSGWAGGIVVADSDPEGALLLCKQIRQTENPLAPILLLINKGQLKKFKINENLFDDFCVTPFHPEELERRLNHLFFKFGRGSQPGIIKYGSLVLNIETYQATIDSSPLDLTYMEYELLRFLATQPGKVFTRETLLNQVWGYDYYGGGRTVDVHIRRLRAKLGEEHANLISTVRSVGYRFGQSRWGS
ncbi:MAG: response regulator transcription factor [Actinomycetota bacterium]|nr:response regulator transcription factor [Actinomycetota bacterium]|tara:strand:+ start:2310 stop:2993 length:684 start_codon:yes stop_codon:yes gene_type:complete